VRLDNETGKGDHVHFGADVKAVHGDLTALIKAGIVLRKAEGVVFPYDTIKIEYELRATA